MFYRIDRCFQRLSLDGISLNELSSELSPRFKNSIVGFIASSEDYVQKILIAVRFVRVAKEKTCIYVINPDF